MKMAHGPHEASKIAPGASQGQKTATSLPGPAGLTREQIMAEAAKAFRPVGLALPFPTLATFSSPTRRLVSPLDIRTCRDDIRVDVVVSLAEAFREKRRLPPVRLGQVHGETDLVVTQDGNHRVIAARLLGLPGIHAEVEIFDYRAAADAYAIWTHPKSGEQFVVPIAGLAAGEVPLMHRIPSGEEGKRVKARLRELGFGETPA